MKIFKLPDLGEGLPDAIIREWYVKVGDMVSVDQQIVAMETAKALVDVPAPFAGKVEKLYGEVGATIDTGQPLIGFEGAADAGEPQDKGTVVGSIETSDHTLQEDSAGLQRTTVATKALKVTPAVRMLARQLNVDLNTLTPSGEHITAADVQAAATLPTHTAVTTLSGDITPLSGVRRAMALSMTKAHQEVATASIMDEADLHAWQPNQDITLRIIRAMAAACQQVPMLNIYYDGQRMGYQENATINLGIAVDTPYGLYVPVLKDIAQRTDESLRADLNRFKQQAQERSIPQKDLQGATILMSNIGAIAGQYAAPIVTPPMVAIVAFGRIKNSVVLVNEQLATHRIMPISLTFDHRPITGGDAARFLKVLIQELER